MSSKSQIYQQIDIRARVESANPHQLIALLYEGLVGALTASRMAIEYGDLAAKSHHISRSMGIFKALDDALDDSVEGDFPHNLHALYGYMSQKTLEASHHLDVKLIDEVLELVLTIKSGWDSMPSAQA